MNTENIKVKINDYINAVDQVKKARQQWQSKTKSLIKDTLETVKNLSNLGWFVDINDQKINHETVCLAFNDQPSDISYNPNSVYNKLNGKKENLINYGGSLNLSFLNNGRILAWVSYPYIPGIIEKSDIKVLHSFDIDKIDEQTIVQQIELFLDEMIKWKKNEKGEWQKVGFKFGQIDDSQTIKTKQTQSQKSNKKKKM
ncbi:MAG TPA: hypothetical protein VNG53_08140 [Bacteroidia bacterium]|nr:hypothetical protein [Bacteroidia bacterium]